MANPLYGQNKYDNSRDDSVTIKSSGSLSNAGTSSWIPNPDSQSFGIYEAVYELSFGATTGGSVTIATADNTLVKTVATVPANAFFLDAKILTSEVFDSDDEKGVDLAVCSTTPVDGTTVMTSTGLVIVACELKSSSSGAVNSLVGSVFSGTTASSVVAGGAGTHLCLINTDGSNVADPIQTGKVIVYIKYAGSAAPVANELV